MKTGWTYKGLLLALAALLLTGAGFIQGSLNRQRAELGLTRLTPLENAPPVLALTTQALGGFRGLIADLLWIRANDLQLEDKFFEMVQLSDWITKLEPHFVQVWVVQAWNMAYNISVKLNSPADRWRWVQRGIELLRDEGLLYNPNEPLIYRELAWFFQHKMGAELDEFHYYYKSIWAEEMTRLLGGGRPNFEELAHPTTEEAKRRAALLREKYKMDPRVMRAVDERWGPLDWRLPETHAIYWATVGIEKCKPDQLTPLRRVIYQSMQLAFRRGTMFAGPDGRVRLVPNLAIIEKANAAFLEMMAADKDPTKVMVYINAHKNFLREATYQLYFHNRLSEAEKLYRSMRERYPDAVPPGVSLAEYAFAKATETVQGINMNRVTSLLQALITQSYLSLINDQDDQAEAYMVRAREFWDLYYKKTDGSKRIALPPLEDLKRETLQQLLDPKTGLLPAPLEKLRQRMGLPAQPAAPAEPGARPLPEAGTTKPAAGPGG